MSNFQAMLSYFGGRTSKGVINRRQMKRIRFHLLHSYGGYQDRIHITWKVRSTTWMDSIPVVTNTVLGTPLSISIILTGRRGTRDDSETPEAKEAQRRGRVRWLITREGGELSSRLVFTAMMNPKYNAKKSVKNVRIELEGGIGSRCIDFGIIGAICALEKKGQKPDQISQLLVSSWPWVAKLLLKENIDFSDLTLFNMS